MSETLWAVIIGGFIAVFGSAGTQLLLFWLNNRKEKQNRRRQFIELLTRGGIKHGNIFKLDLDEQGFYEFGSIVRKAADESKTYSDDEIAAILGYVKFIVDDYKPDDA